MKKIKNIFWSLIVLLIFIYAIGKIWKNVSNRKVLERGKNMKVKAVIINERNSIVNSPVSDDFSYSYCFFANGKNYINDSHMQNLHVGDSIDIEYVVDHPEINRALDQ